MEPYQVFVDEYPGDENWDRFVDFYRKGWEHAEEKAELISAYEDENLAIAVWGVFGKYALSWKDMKVDSLRGKTPGDILGKHPFYSKILRTIIMRY
jgi:hypothetical protein